MVVVKKRECCGFEGGVETGFKDLKVLLNDRKAAAKVIRKSERALGGEMKKFKCVLDLSF